MEENIKLLNTQQLFYIDIGSVVTMEVLIVKQAYWSEPNFGVYCGLLINRKNIAKSLKTVGNKNYISINGNFPFNIPTAMSYFIKGKVELYNGNKTIKLLHIEPRLPSFEEFLEIHMMLGSYVSSTIITRLFSEEYKEKLKSKEDLFDLINYSKDMKNKYEFQDDIEKMSIFENIETILSHILMTFIKTKIYTQCLEWGFNYAQINFLYSKYGCETTMQIKKNPYSIISDSDETEFKFPLCDKIASNFDTFCYDSEERLKAAVDFALSKFETNGHCYQTIDAIIPVLKNILTVKLKQPFIKDYFRNKALSDNNIISFFDQKISLDRQEVMNILTNCYEKTLYIPSDKRLFDIIKKAIKEGYVVLEGDRVYRKSIYSFETYVSDKVKIMMDYANKHKIDMRIDVNNLLPNNSLEKQQKAVIEEVLSKEGGILIINGPAGSGKSYCCKAMIDAYCQMNNISNSGRNLSFLLMAPTGRASKIMTERSGLPSSTIHRGLNYDPIEDKWCCNETNPIYHNVVLIDEVSMMNIELAYRVLSACQPNTKLVLFGDTHQLQAVGAGNVLLDLINSQQVPVITLDVIKRQLDGSDIIKAANCVLHQELLPESGLNKDMFYMSKSDECSTVIIALQCIKKIFSKRQGTIQNTIVITPQKEGITGVNYLNHLLQKLINPEGKESKIIAGTYENPDNKSRVQMFFRQGDSVINIKNNAKTEWYERVGNIFEAMKNIDSTSNEYQGVFNGEIGIIEEIEMHGLTTIMWIRFDDHYIKYSSDFSNLNLGYAITTHKAQGSQWENVVTVVGNINDMLNCNNNIYTIMTRASKFLAIATTNDKLQYGIKNIRVQKRNTTLFERLTNQIESEIETLIE